MAELLSASQFKAIPAGLKLPTHAFVDGRFMEFRGRPD